MHHCEHVQMRYTAPLGDNKSGLDAAHCPLRCWARWCDKNSCAGKIDARALPVL